MALSMSQPDVMQPVEHPRPRSRRARMLVGTAFVAALVVGVGIGVALDRGPEPDPGAAISEAVMLAWATGDPDDVAAIYREDAVFVFDGERLATGLDEITDMIGDVENSYRAVGPAASYEGPDGDLYVSALVEVVGPAHPLGVPVVGFYRVHEGKVIRHVVMDAEHY